MTLPPLYWLYLVLAIATESAGLTLMKLAEGFTRPLPSVLSIVMFLSSFGLLTLTLKGIPVTLVYAIWSGVGTALITVIGVLYFKEPMTAVKLAGISLIVVGVVALNVAPGGSTTH